MVTLNRIARMYSTSMSQSTNRHRRGVTYIMVLGTTMLVAVITLGALQSVRSQTRMSRMIGNSSAAAELAASGIAHARLILKNDANWRTTYASGAWSTEQAIGTGYFRWKVVDATNAKLTYRVVSSFAELRR